MTTLRHVSKMPRWASRKEYDHNIRRKIKKMIKHIDHHQPWEDTVIEARRARGLVNQAGKVWNDHLEYGSSEVVELDHKHSLHQLNSIGKMRSVGRRVGNCLTKSSFYHDQLRKFEAKFYEVKNFDDTVACFSIDCESLIVLEFETYELETWDTELSQHILWAIAKQLGIHGDHTGVFSKNGIFPIFIDGIANHSFPMYELDDYQLWWDKGQIVVRDTLKGEWTHFVWNQDEWYHDGSSQFNEYCLEVMCRVHSEINHIVRCAGPICSES